MTEPVTEPDIVVHHAELSVVTKSQEQIYVVGVEREKFDDFVGLVAYVVPALAFETRAAEYDIDVRKAGGWDDLFQLIFARDPADEAPSEELVNDPSFIYNAPTIAHARKAKLNRIRANLGNRKLRGQAGVSPHRLTINQATALENSGDEDPLEFIKRTAPMSVEHMRVRQEFVRRKRNLIRARRANRSLLAMDDLDDAARQALRDTLLNNRQTPEQLAQQLLGDLDVREMKTPGREGPPSKQL